MTGKEKHFPFIVKHYQGHIHVKEPEKFRTFTFNLWKLQYHFLFFLKTFHHSVDVPYFPVRWSEDRIKKKAETPFWASPVSVPGDSHFQSVSQSAHQSLSPGSWRSSSTTSVQTHSSHWVCVCMWESSLVHIIIYNGEIKRLRILTSAPWSMSVRRGVGDWHGR